MRGEVQEKVLRIKNLHCANCAASLERELNALKGVSSARVDFLTQKVILLASEEGLYRAIKYINRFEKVRVIDADRIEKPKNRRWEWLRLLFSAFFLLLGVVFTKFPFGELMSFAGYSAFAVAYGLAGYDILLSTAKNLRKGKIFDENFLMSLASFGAFALGETLEGVAVALLYQTGEFLQELAVGSSRKSVAEIMRLKTDYATKIIGGEYQRVTPEELEVGDEVLVKAGEKIPCDGILIDEFAVLDKKALTGESQLQEVTLGAELISGAINAGNAFKMRIAKVYEESAVQKILDAVEGAAAKRSKKEKFITEFARYYTPAVCIFALLFATLPPAISYFLRGETEFLRYFRSALTFLVISCPCALVVSVPLSYFSAVGACAKKGVLVKGAVYLDILAQVSIVAFDKTGTLTEGNFEILEVYAKRGEKNEILSYAAALEKESAHPISQAFAGIDCSFIATEIEEKAGRGLSGKIDEKQVYFGNASFLKENGVVFEELKGIDTTLYLAVEKEYYGAVTVGDRIRAGAKEELSALKTETGARVAMLTGDRTERAQKVSESLGIERTYAELLPLDKVAVLEELKKTGKVLYVGDGINDAPVMTAADCALSMGKLGSAAAVEASDFVLVSDDISAISSLFQTAKKVKKIVWQNVVFSITAKLLFMGLGAFGVLPLALAVFADVGVMLLAVCNSLRIS